MNLTIIFAAGAQELAMFLTDELKLEKQSASNHLPKLHGFQLISSSGPSVVLTRKYYCETYKEFLGFTVVVAALLLLLLL